MGKSDPIFKTTRKRGFVDPLPLYIIQCEDTDTSVQYFNNLKQFNRKIKIEVLPSSKGSSPNKLIGNINQKIRDLAPGKLTLHKNYEAWIVHDRDNFTELQLQEISKWAIGENKKAAISNPCFEIWLILHCQMFTKNYPKTSSAKSQECKKACEKIHFDFYERELPKNEKVYPYTSSQIRAAIERAETLERKKECENDSFTEVHHLVKKLIPA